jgi:hypothetical protein
MHFAERLSIVVLHKDLASQSSSTSARENSKAASMEIWGRELAEGCVELPAGLESGFGGAGNS